MSDLQQFGQIDTVIDRVIDNPSKAAQIKEAIHCRGLAGHSGWKSSQRQHSWDEGSGEDLWDNLPI